MSDDFSSAFFRSAKWRRKCGPIYAGAQGMWLYHRLAHRRLYHVIGYSNDCSCRVWGTTGRAYPRHLPEVGFPEFELEVRCTTDPPENNCDAGLGVPTIRCVQMSRDSFGRWLSGQHLYYWKPDVEKWIRWYAQHIAEAAERRLAGAEVEHVD